MILEEEKELVREIAQTIVSAVIQEMVSQGVKMLADEINRKLVPFESEVETSKAHDAWDGNSDFVSYRDGWLDCARSREIK